MVSVIFAVLKVLFWVLTTVVNMEVSNINICCFITIFGLGISWPRVPATSVTDKQFAIGHRSLYLYQRYVVSILSLISFGDYGVQMFGISFCARQDQFCPLSCLIFIWTIWQNQQLRSRLFVVIYVDDIGLLLIAPLVTDFENLLRMCETELHF